VSFSSFFFLPFSSFFFLPFSSFPPPRRRPVGEPRSDSDLRRIERLEEHVLACCACGVQGQTVDPEFGRPEHSSEVVPVPLHPL
jgi:hypothetical protein